MPPLPATNQCATPVPGRRETACPARTSCCSSPAWNVPDPSRMTKISSEAEWQWGTYFVSADWTNVFRPVRTEPPVAPRIWTVPSMITGASASATTFFGLGQLQFAGRGLALPGMRAGGDLHGRVHPQHAGAREPGRRRPRPLAEGQDVEAVVSRDERVVLRRGDVDDRVALAHLARCRAAAVVLPEDARTAEHVEDLLLRELGVDRRRAPAGLDLQQRDADAVGPDRIAQVHARQAHRTGLEDAALDLVPVGDHDSSNRIGCAPSQSTSCPIAWRCSSPSTTLAKTFPASWPALLAKQVSPYGKRISTSLTPPGYRSSWPGAG